MKATQTGSGPSLDDSTACQPPLLAVDVVRRASQWEGEAAEPLLVRAAEAAYGQAAAKALPAELSLLLCGDTEIRGLNSRWRGKDEPTNVLSFPLGAVHAGGGPRPLGDVALAYETVAREARGRGIPLARHAAHLVVHGVLHLLGHDHENAEQAREMEALEVRIMDGLGLPDPYALELMTAGEDK